MAGAFGTGDMDRLQTVLDVFGSDRRRWPQADADKLSLLIETDSRARRLLVQAEALDRVLSAAPAGDVNRLIGLAHRIVAASVAASDEPLPHPSNVVPFPHRGRPAAGPLRSRHQQNLPALLTLAASLIIGIMVGVSGFATPVLQQVAGLTETDADGIGTANPSAAEDAQEGELL